MRRTFLFIWSQAKIVFLVLAIVIPVRMFLFQPFLVQGDSMQPNFQTGNYLIVDELSYRLRAPERGEVIVFQYPYDPSQKYIKRIIGLPGETVEVQDGKVVIYQEGTAFILEESSYLPDAETAGSLKLSLKDHEYFVLGDNREFSSDSRIWGILQDRYIIGRALFEVLPITSASFIKTPAY